MGQGQEIVARKYMAAAAAEGHWVLLQNTHLSLKYLIEVRGCFVTVCDLAIIGHFAVKMGLSAGVGRWLTLYPCLQLQF